MKHVTVLMMILGLGLIWAFPTDLAKDVVNNQGKTPMPGVFYPVKPDLSSRAWFPLLSADFESGMPPGWTVVDGNGDGFMWTTGTTPDLFDPPPAFGTAYAYYSDDDAGNGVINTNEELISPAMSMPAAAESLKITYGWGFSVYEAGEILDVRARFFTGGVWGVWNIIASYNTTSSSGTATIDLTSFLPADSVQVEWMYHDETSVNHWGYACATDNVLLEYFLAPADDDVGIESIQSPTGLIPVGIPVDVIATACNFSTGPETFDVHAEIRDAFATVVFTKDTLGITLGAGLALQINFGTWLASPVGDYTVWVWTIYAPDPVPSNDTLSSPFTVFWTFWDPYTAPGATADRLTHATVWDKDNDMIYMIGGTPDGTPGSNVDFCYAYDHTTDTWNTGLAGMPTARGWIQGAYWNGRIYVGGGYSNAGTALTNFEIYDIAGNSWSSGPAVPEARLAQGEVAYNGSIYEVGGVNAALTAGLTTVYRYDIAGNTWTLTTNPLPEQFDMGGVTIWDNTIYIAGGYNRGAGTVYTNLYAGVINPANPDDITWSSPATLPTPHMINGAGALNGKIYMLGGFLNDFTVTNEFWEYDPVFTTWYERDPYPVTIARNHMFICRKDITIIGGFYGVAGDANGDWGPPNNYYYKFEWQDIEENTKQIKPSKPLFSIVPNIGNQNAIISFSFASPSRVSLTLYNALGQKVKSLYNSSSVKSHNVNLGLNELISGVYFVKLTTDNSSATAKLVVTK